MADTYKMNNGYTGVKSIVLTKLLYLETGQINIASPSVSVETTGPSTIIAVPAGLNFDISSIKFRLSGSNTTGNIIASVGTNAATYDNILPSTTFTGLNTIGETWREQIQGKYARAVGGSTITINITNAVTGVGAILEVYLFGEIVP